MSHELDFSTGQAAIALRGGAQTAWHGLGQEILATDSIEAIQRKAGLDWAAKTSEVTYHDRASGLEYTDESTQVLFRSDTGGKLGYVSKSRYNTHQPAEIMEFFSGFLQDNRLSIETAGALRGGEIIWCLAKLGPAYDFLMAGNDKIDSYIRLQTSFNGGSATSLTATTIRQVCANTMRMIDRRDGDHAYKVNHTSAFDERARAKLQAAFGLIEGEQRLTSEVWNALQERKVKEKEAQKFVRDVFGYELVKGEVLNKGSGTPAGKVVANQMAAMELAFKNSPGAELKSAKGTAFGLLQAATYWVDHKATCRDNFDGNEKSARLAASWYGLGEKTKQAALWHAAELAGVEELLAA